MSWNNTSISIKGINYNVGQQIDGLSGACYTNVTGTPSGETFEGMANTYGYTYYFGGIWQTPGGEQVAAPYGIRIGVNGDNLFAANADNFPAARYLISFDANGGSGAPDRQTKVWGEDFVFPGQRPTRTGHTFLGWSNPAIAGGTLYQPGQSVRGLPDQDITWYARWRVNTYTYTFDANGGSGAPGNQIKTYGQHFTFPAAKPQRTGHTFLGWSNPDIENGQIYAAGQQVIGLPDKNIIWYAKWRAITYTVAYSANGGSGAPGKQTKTHDVDLTLSSAVPKRSGYTFLGWSLTQNGEVDYRPGGTYGRNSSATLYAVWARVVYTVTFDAATNGGSVSEKTRKVNHGSKIGTLPAPVKRYYKFVGWFSAPSGGTKIDANQVITANVTYYAQFVIDASFLEREDGRWLPKIVFEYTGGQWQKVFAFERSGDQWKQGIGG